MKRAGQALFISQRDGGTDQMQTSTLKKEILTILGVMLCSFLWGSAFPGIKIGYSLWNIASGDTWRIIRFAGFRFFLAGILVIAIGSLMKKKFLFPKKNEWGKILLLSLFQTIGQYVFFYIGLAHTSGVNSAVVDSLTVFFAILVACFIFRTERLTVRKILGCILGLAGIILINITSEGFTFHPLGDGLVALSALCYGVSSNMIKKYAKDHDTVLFSGYQFALGGLIMTVFGQTGVWLLHEPSASQQEISYLPALGMLVYLALVSSVAYTLWGILLRTNDVSKISIFGFINPVIGVVLSAILLKETGTLGIRYFLALLLISLGIVIVNIKVTKGKELRGQG